MTATRAAGSPLRLHSSAASGLSTAENYFRFAGHPSGTVAFEPTMNRRLLTGLNLANFQYVQAAKTYDLLVNSLILSRFCHQCERSGQIARLKNQIGKAPVIN